MTRSRPLRLTAFQSLLREWSALAPYNFIHVMRLAGPADVAGWQNAVDIVMRELAVSSKTTAIEQPATDLKTHLETELRRPFSPLAAPFRFFLIDANTDGHWLGITLDHWIADDFSCRCLLQRMYSIYDANENVARGPRLEWASASSPKQNRWLEWLSFLRHAMRLRHACRTPVADPLDFDVRTLRTELPEGSLEAIKKLAKNCGTTFHDIFLAATAQTFGAARQLETGTRRDAVAIASAMDARRFESGPNRNGFGLIIGQYMVINRRPHELSLTELSRRIAAQTRYLKTVPGTHLFAPMLWCWRLSRSPRSKATFFTRGAPMVAGLSNVNLTGSWIEQARIIEYRRIGPTGPLVPMLLMITTFRGRIFIDTTFRTTAFSPTDAHQLIENLVQRLPGGRKCPEATFFVMRSPAFGCNCIFYVN